MVWAGGETTEVRGRRSEVRRQLGTRDYALGTEEIEDFRLQIADLGCEM